MQVRRCFTDKGTRIKYALARPTVANIIPTTIGISMTAANFCENETEGAKHSGATISILRLNADRMCRSSRTGAGHFTPASANIATTFSASREKEMIHA